MGVYRVYSADFPEVGGRTGINNYPGDVFFDDATGSILYIAPDKSIKETVVGSSSISTAVVASGPMNYVQNLNPQVNLSSSPNNAGSVTITTTGGPVLIVATGDANPLNGGDSWCVLQIYRGTAAIGGKVQAEQTSANVNVPYCVQTVDTPPAGTYTYYLKMVANSQNFQFGEASGPSIVAVELNGVVGPQGPQGVGIKGFASGYVDAGQFVTLDNLKFTVTTSGSRGLSCATVSGTATLSISGTYGFISGVGAAATTYPGANYNTTPSGSWFNWSFPNAGDGSTYLVNDYTNKRFYRVNLMIGASYLGNFISIERLG